MPDSQFSAAVLTEELVLNWMAQGIQQGAAYLFVVYDPMMQEYQRHLIPKDVEPYSVYVGYKSFEDDTAERVVKMINLEELQEFTY